MNRRLPMLLLGCALSLCAAEPVAFRPGEVWNDTAGRPINAHGGGILFHDGTYYWYGENKEGPSRLPDATKHWGGYRVEVSGVRCYSSRDLLNWKDEGLVLRAVTNDPAHDLHPSKVCERPKVVFNAKTGKFVMWMHVDDERYQAARAGVAVADAPTGPFRYLESVKPDGHDSRDQTVFVDDDGRAYRFFASEGNATMHIALLADDYLKHSGRFVRAFEKASLEAPAVFKRGGKYWLIASGCTGWAPNAAHLAVADSVWGPWKELGNPCRGLEAEKTFRGQSTFVLPVAGRVDAFIFMADRWNARHLPDSRYLWLPVRFEEGRPILEWRDAWDLSAFGT